MPRSTMNLVALGLGLGGVGLILGQQTFPGVVLLFLGLGLWAADLRWMPATQSSRRLIARGSPALLMIGLMLGAAQLYVVTTDALLPAVATRASLCPADTLVGHMLLEVLEALH